VQGSAAYLRLKVKRNRAKSPDARPSLGGTVFDGNRAVINGASVMLKREGGDEQKTTTDDEGRFLFSSLEPGTYTVSVLAPGFRLSENSLKLTEGEDVSLDLTLDVVLLGRAAFLPAGEVPDRIAAD
jgi:hypothetical protein